MDRAHSIPTIVHNETTFGPEKCVAILCQGPESSTFQSIKCVICNLKCSTKTLQHTSESWHFQNFSFSWTNKVFCWFFKDKLVSYQKTSSHATDPDLFSSLDVSDVSLGIFLMFWLYFRDYLYTFKLWDKEMRWSHQALKWIEFWIS